MSEEEDSGIWLRELWADGGAARNDFLMQFQADILESVIRRPYNVESTANGVFLFAGLAAGLFSDKEELKRKIRVESEFTQKWRPFSENGLSKGGTVQYGAPSCRGVI